MYEQHSPWEFGYRKIISPLTYVRWADRPSHIPQKERLKGRRAKGMTYERGVKKHLDRILPKLFSSFLTYSGAWIHFIDKTGHGYAQPDFIIELPTSVIIIEIKLTQTDNAERQTKLLYLPLVQNLIPNKPVFLLQVCKNLRYIPKDGTLIKEIESILEREPERLYTLHFIL